MVFSPSITAQAPTALIQRDLPQSVPAKQISAPRAKPVTVEDIEYYLKNKISNKLIAARIAERGVNFQLNDKVKKRLQKHGADRRVFRAIRKANATMMP